METSPEAGFPSAQPFILYFFLNNPF